MSQSLNLFEKTLKSRGLSITKPRLAVFEALQGEEPLTMNEVVTRSGDFDRASIYRTIALFEKLGIVHRLQIGWKYKLELTDEYHRHHHHLACTRCERTIPFEEDSHLLQHLANFADKHDFKMRGHQLEITGLCDRCQ